MTSIVLLVRDRYALTEQCLFSLFRNTAQGSFNLTVVNDGSEERRVNNLLSRYAGLDAVTMLTVANGGHVLSQLKNIGVAWSEQRFGRGDWLYIGDSDTAYLPAWLEKLTAFAKETEPLDFRLWGGQIHPFHGPVSQEAVERYSVLDGPSWLMRWDTWDTVGPYDRTTGPGVCQSEEYPWCEKLLRFGVRHHGKESGHDDVWCSPGHIGVIHPHVVIHTGLTHADGSDCVGRKEREAMIPAGVLAL